MSIKETHLNLPLQTHHQDGEHETLKLQIQQVGAKAQTQLLKHFLLLTSNSNSRHLYGGLIVSATHVLSIPKQLLPCLRPNEKIERPQCCGTVREGYSKKNAGNN